MGFSDSILDRSEGDGGENLLELSLSEGWTGTVRVLSLKSEDEGDSFSVVAATVSTLTVLLSAPTALLAVHS